MATIKVPEEILSDIKDIADEHGRSPHWIMLEAIKKYVQAETSYRRRKRVASVRR